MAQMYDNKDAEISTVERGILKVYTGSVAVTGVANFNIDFVVPTGKRWVPKLIRLAQNGGTFTIGGLYHTMLTPVSSFIVSVVSATNTTFEERDKQLTLPSGFTIRLITLVSAHVADGQMDATLICQEYDTN